MYDEKYEYDVAVIFCMIDFQLNLAFIHSDTV